MNHWIPQGRHTTQDEITACAYQAVAVDNKYNGAPVQVRVTMGKEPRHFLAIFKGKLIIYEVTVISSRSPPLPPTYSVSPMIIHPVEIHQLCLNVTLISDICLAL